MLGEYECLACHEEFEVEITEDEEDESQPCPLCGFNGELQQIVFFKD